MGLVDGEEYTTITGSRQLNNNPQPETVWRALPSATIMPIVQMPTSMPDAWAFEIEDCYDVWFDHLMRNQTRFAYYDGRNRLKDFGISTPPELLDVETVVGWPNKAVMSLAVRSRFDGFTAGTDDLQAMLDGISRRSRLRVKYRQAVESEGIHGCSFGVVTMAGSDARIDIYDAEHASGRWDDARGRLAYGLTVDIDRQGNITCLTLHDDTADVYAWPDGSGQWAWEARPHGMGRAVMEAFAYRPTQRKPLGQSRITRAVMSITDSAVRAALGGDISFQFAVAPQKYLLGADRKAFANKTRWEAYIGNILAVGRDSNGEMPQFGQLPQASMQQYTEFMRDLAARFSGETNVPISQLGVIHDNPSSAEAIYAASEPLIIEAQDLNDGNRETLRTLASMAVAAEIDTPLDQLDARWLDFSPNMANPAMPSIVSTADAAVKIASVVPGFAGTESFWKMVGLPEDTRREIDAQVAEANAQSLLTSLFATQVERSEVTDG